jgi:hypothetical protein
LAKAKIFPPPSAVGHPACAIHHCIPPSGARKTGPPFLPQDDRAALNKTNDMERILADIDAHRGNGRI